MTWFKYELAEMPYSKDHSVSSWTVRTFATGEMLVRLILQSFCIIYAFALLSTFAEAASLETGNSEPKTIVAKLYRDFAWEAVMHEPTWIGLIDQSRETLERYFDKRLTILILEDRACAKREGMCRLNFSPIWGSQDPSASDLEVQQSDKSNLILVKFRYPSTNEIMTLMYQLSKTSNGWRISDISGNINGLKWSLLSILNSQR